jgi:hypothetical protein
MMIDGNRDTTKIPGHRPAPVPPARPTALTGPEPTRRGSGTGTSGTRTERILGEPGRPFMSDAKAERHFDKPI